jgi:hypothetical protein
MHSLDVVHGSDRRLGISLLGVTDESETTAAASISVLDDNLTSTDIRQVFGRQDTEKLTASSTAPNSSNF